MKTFIFPVSTAEPVFVEKTVSYHGQPIGMILADSREIATAAANKIKVTYENVTKPVIDIGDALNEAETSGTLEKRFIGTFKSHKPEEPTKHRIKGEFRIGSQYHYHMETQTCVCIPTEAGIDVFSSTQYMDHAQTAISDVLGIPNNHVNVQVKRVGGGFGGKIVRASFVAAGCAVGAYAADRPVRVVLDMETNMQMIGKRLPYLMRYEVGFNDDGRIGSFRGEIFCDAGYSPNEATSLFAALHMQGVYDAVGWEIKPGVLLTNTPANASTRAPGSVQGAALTEYVMEHISHTLSKDPLQVKMANFMKKGDPFFIGEVFDPTKLVPLEVENLMSPMIHELKETGDYENRKQFIEKFNKDNRWKKRGLAVVPLRYPVDYFPGKFQAAVVVYAADGTVAVSHAGIEMGQGINTKVAQTVAETLNIPMGKIQIKPANNFIGNNSFPTGGSVGSELCCFAAGKACENLLERMKPIRENLKNPTWEELIAECNKLGIELSAFYSQGPADGLKGYHVWAVNLTEVEIDVLTGEYKIVRVDLIEDAGKSLSPGVDIGQIEGGYVFGQGLWTTERILHDKETGKLHTDRTWEYKPPETKDIPEDFRITLLRNAPNPLGVLRSKATGEPIVCSSVCVLFAIRDAIASARREVGNSDWFQMNGPVTPEDIVRYCLTAESKFEF